MVGDGRLRKFRLVTASRPLDLIPSVDLGGFRDVNLTPLARSAAGTSPTLSAKVTTADINETDDFADATSFTQASSNTVELKYNSFFARFLSAKWVVGGTSPVFVFTIVGTAK
jgi:hypothetical protein